MPPNRTELRDFIVQRFNRDELGTLCGDYFTDFYLDYEGTNLTLTVLTNKLIEHCERRDLLDNLRAAVHKARPELYEKQFGRPRVTEVRMRPRDPNQVFLSYAHEDAELARRVSDDLRAAGLAVWMAPESIQPGELWAKAIDRGLRESGIFVVMLTPNAAASSWVEHEILVAVQFERNRQMRHLIPLLAQPCDLNRLPALLQSYQAVDLVNRYDYGLSQVVARVKEQVQPSRGSKPQDGAVPIPEPRKTEVVSRSTPTADSLLIELPRLGFRLELVRVPAGEFLMGSDQAKDRDAYHNELPQHRVYLDEYFIGKYPVTVEQFAVFAKATGYKTIAEQQGSSPAWTGSFWTDVRGANWRHLDGPKSDVNLKQSHPVTRVSWDDANAFCKWLSEISGYDANLPTEAQWEKAARGSGDDLLYPWGDIPPDEKRCNFNMHIGNTTAVGKYSPLGDSPYGCADMAGNVWEWCIDRYDDKEYDRRAGKEVINPTRPESDGARVLRGGAFSRYGERVRCAYRGNDAPDFHCIYYGFRVCVPPIP
jgi:formylglycine-generating enzyme required for sulfatase activity